MAKIYLISGYIGFGKTTYSTKLAKEINAVVITPDDIMKAMLTRYIPNNYFRHYLPRAEKLAWELTKKIIETGVDVVFDYNFWSREDRKIGWEKAKTISDDVTFHQVLCSLETARKRFHHRNEFDRQSLFMPDNIFEKFIPNFEPISDDEGYPYTIYYSE